MTITALDKRTIKLINTTQVITSVYTAVKELIENSLDANSKNIEVNLIDSGLSLIEVKDDGSGIYREDVPFMALPSYTSKISSFTDLEDLQTYGFRGEALNALCAIADVVILTKTDQDDTAMSYIMDNNGNIVKSELCHRSNGTTVQVKHIFKQVPVRRQVISNPRKASQDVKLVETLLRSFGICRFSVRIIYKVNNNIIFMKPSMNSLKDAASYILGKKVTSSMEWIHYESGEITVNVMIPSKLTENVSEVCQSGLYYIFINNRPVTYKEIEKVMYKNILEYFGDKLPPRKKPLFLLYVLIDPAELDVNLEPNKTMILLQNQQKFLDTIDTCLKKYYDIEMEPTPKESIHNDSSNPYQNDTMDAINSESEWPACKKRKCESEVTIEEKHARKVEETECNSNEANQRINNISHHLSDLGSILNTLVSPNLSESDSNDAFDDQGLVTRFKKDYYNHISTNEDKDTEIPQEPSNPLEEEKEIDTLSRLPVVDLGEDFSLDSFPTDSITNNNKENEVSKPVEDSKGKSNEQKSIPKKKSMDKPITLELWSKGHIVGLKGGTDIQAYNGAESANISKFSSVEEPPNTESTCVGFQKFSRCIRKQVIKENPSLSAAALAQKMIQLWKDLSSEERAYYRDVGNQNIASQKNKKKILPDSQDRKQTTILRTTVPWNIDIQKVTTSFIEKSHCKKYMSNFVIGRLKDNLWLVQNKAQIWLVNSLPLQTELNNVENYSTEINIANVEQLLKRWLLEKDDLSLMVPIHSLV